MLSALLAVCNSSGEALDMGQQTAIKEVGSQLSILLNVKLVRKATVIILRMTLNLVIQMSEYKLSKAETEETEELGLIVSIVISSESYYFRDHRPREN